MSSPSRDSTALVDHSANEVRVALTIIKTHAQLLARRRWDLGDSEREHLLSRLRTIDQAVNRAVEGLASLLQVAEDERSQDGAG